MSSFKHIIFIALFAWLGIISYPVFAAPDTTTPDTATPDTATNNGFSIAGDDWPGYWFICEFSQRQKPPDDGCKMFDDEGFQLADGRLRYTRITQSDETACRGNKAGQCFSAETPAIDITRTNRGRLTLGDKLFKVRYFGCSQTFYFADTPDYREIWPDDKRCFWASKRRFYIAPFRGEVTLVD